MRDRHNREKPVRRGLGYALVMKIRETRKKKKG